MIVYVHADKWIKMKNYHLIIITIKLCCHVIIMQLFSFLTQASI